MSEVKIHFIPLPEGVEGMARERKDGGYTIAVNSLLSEKNQAKTLAHEITHIQRDHFNSGADLKTIEAEADAPDEWAKIEAARIVRKAAKGNIKAIVTILKAIGELPQDYKL